MEIKFLLKKKKKWNKIILNDYYVYVYNTITLILYVINLINIQYFKHYQKNNNVMKSY